MSKPTRDIRWAAGFYEGEGWFGFARHRSNRRSCRIIINSTDSDALEEFGRIVGVGKLYGPYKDARGKWKPIYRWAIQNHNEAQKVAARLRPYMLGRRANQIDAVLKEAE